jgi:hypothetical protein
MIEAIKNVVNGIGQMDDTSAQRDKLIALMGFCEELNKFACIFTGQPTGLAAAAAWMIGSKDSETQYADAASAINAMHPMLDAIKTMSRKLNTLEDVAISLKSMETIFRMANPETLVEKGEKLKKFAEDLKKADSTLPSKNKLAEFFDNLTSSLTKGDFSKIDQVAASANRLGSAINKMNSELTKLRTENSQTMKDVSNMNNSGGNPLGNAISSIGNAIRGGGGSGGSSSGANEQILREIADNVKSIAENTPPLESSGIFGTRTG